MLYSVSMRRGNGSGIGLDDVGRKAESRESNKRTKPKEKVRMSKYGVRFERDTTKPKERRGVKRSKSEEKRK